MRVPGSLLLLCALAGCSRASNGGLDAGSSEGTSSVSAATLRNSVAGGSLPVLCPLFSQDLAAQVSTLPLKPGGTERVAEHIRFCFYTVDGKPVARIGAGLTMDMGTLPEKNDCLHPPAVETVPGRLLDGVGQWACLTGEHILVTGNGKYRVTIFGDAGLEALKKAAAALFSKLPAGPTAESPTGPDR